jgi:hypothetical protein
MFEYRTNTQHYDTGDDEWYGNGNGYGTVVTINETTGDIERKIGYDNDTSKIKI